MVEASGSLLRGVLATGGVLVTRTFLGSSCEPEWTTENITEKRDFVEYYKISIKFNEKKAFYIPFRNFGEF